MNPSTNSVSESLCIAPSAYLVNDSLDKLRALGVVASWKNGRDVAYSATGTGRICLLRYRELRDVCLIDALDAPRTDNALEPRHWRLRARAACACGLCDEAVVSAALL